MTKEYGLPLSDDYKIRNAECSVNDATRQIRLTRKRLTRAKRSRLGFGFLTTLLPVAIACIYFAFQTYNGGLGFVAFLLAIAGLAGFFGLIVEVYGSDEGLSYIDIARENVLEAEQNLAQAEESYSKLLMEAFENDKVKVMKDA